MVKALPPNTSNEPLGEWILPWTARRGEHLVNAHSLNSVSEIATIHSVTVTYQITRCRVLRKGFDDLLCCPFCGGMFRDIEMQHATPFMRNEDEDKQHFQLQCGNRKEVDGDQLTDVVTQKGFQVWDGP